jgi:RimJ/RimL family protein N-acetyltransferase
VGVAPPAPLPSLATERLLLRQFTAADLDAWAAISADPEVARHLGDGTPLDRVGAWRWMALNLGHWMLRGYGQWALEERDGGALVGRAGLWEPEGWPGLELGWVVARDRWNRGLATEAGRAALAWAFDALGANRVISLIAPANVASIRVAEKLGQRCDERILLGGRPALLYAIARSHPPSPARTGV